MTILVDSLDWGRATLHYDHPLEARGGTNEGCVRSLGEGAALPEGLDPSPDGMIRGVPAEPLVMEGTSPGEAAGLRPVPADPSPAPGNRSPRQEVDWTRDLEIQLAKEALHSRVRQEERELFARLADEGRLGFMLDRGIGAQAARRGAPRPTPSRLYARGAGDNCVVDGTVVADVIAENDHLVVYQEVETTSPVPVEDVNTVLDFYTNHGAEVIEDYFGGVSDMDNNGKITVLTDPTLTGVRAFVRSGDMVFTTTECAASNEMELVHISAGAFHLDNGLWAHAGMVHEAKHVSSPYKRVWNHHIRGRPSGERTFFHPTWIEEGRAGRPGSSPARSPPAACEHTTSRRGARATPPSSAAWRVPGSA